MIFRVLSIPFSSLLITSLALTPAQATVATFGDEVMVSGVQVVANLDQSSAAFGLNAKSLIGIDEADSAQRLEISGQGPANAPSSGGGGGAGDPAYDFAGSKINIGLPTALDDAGYAYLDDLKASGQLTVQEMALIQHQFYDQDIQLSPAFKAVLSIAIGNFVAPGLVGGILSSNAPLWAVKAAEAFASNLMMGGIEGVVSGNFNLGQILEGASFSALTAGLTAGINITLPQGDVPLIAGFGSTQLTLSGLVNAGLDGVITSGLSSAVYGTDFGAGVVDAITRAAVMRVAGASIQEVSDLLGHDVASLEKTIAKATINCLAAQANGASCASGALGTLVTELGLSDPRLLGATSPQDFQNRLELVAAIAGFIASEGTAQNVNATAGAAVLDFENNQGQGGAAALAQMQTLVYMNNSCMASGGSAQACELVLQEFQKGFLAGQQEAALLLIDFIPVVGDIKALAECIQTPTPAICGAAGVSLIPGAGDIAKIVLRKGDEVLEMTVAGGKVIGSGKAIVVSVDTTRATRGTPEYELLNNPPANTRVELSNGTTFRTGEGGYVEEITYQPVNSTGVRDSRQTAVGREGLSGDVGGHIQACRHGGTCDRFNLFPQNSNFNNSAYKSWENEITRSLQNGDNVGNVTVRLNRADPYNPRPDNLTIEYEINGVPFERKFPNQAGQ